MLYLERYNVIIGNGFRILIAERNKSLLRMLKMKNLETAKYYISNKNLSLLSQIPKKYCRIKKCSHLPIVRVYENCWLILVLNCVLYCHCPVSWVTWPIYILFLADSPVTNRVTSMIHQNAMENLEFCCCLNFALALHILFLFELTFGNTNCPF